MQTNQRISSSEMRKLAKESGERIYWDGRVCEDASLADIEEEKVKWFLKEAGHKRGLDIVVTLWKSKLNEAYLDTLRLNERQRKTISYMKRHKAITSKEYAELYTITDRTARNDLKSLRDKKILIQRGSSKKLTYYELSG